MTKTLKVYGSLVFDNGKQVRAVVAAHNQRQVGKAAGISLYQVKLYWVETRNQAEVLAALRTPLHKVIME